MPFALVAPDLRHTSVAGWTQHFPVFWIILIDLEEDQPFTRISRLLPQMK
jgi:hypothetical protein